MGLNASLHNTASKENLKALKKQIKSKSVRINEKVGEKTVLFNAVKNNWKEAVDLLLENGADPNVLCTVERIDGYFFEWTAIHEACRQCNIELLSAMLEHGGDVNLQAHHQMTPLHVAAWHGHVEAVDLLIKAGCDVNSLDRFQESSLVIPICNGDMEIVEALLNAGCQLNTRAWGNLRKMRGKTETDFQDTLVGEGPYSLLSLAIKYAWLPVACLLLKHGYNPNRYDIYDIALDIKKSMGELDENFKHLVNVLIASGYNFKARDEIHLDNLLLPPHIGFTMEMIDWVKSQNAISGLQHLCRRIIRKSLRIHCKQRSVLNSIYKLPLPQSLQDYLALNDVCVIDVPASEIKSNVIDTGDERKPLYLAMPKRRKHTSDEHVYVQFWRQSCCFFK